MKNKEAIEELGQLPLSSHQIEKLASRESLKGEKTSERLPVFAKSDRETWGSLKSGDWRELTPHQVSALVADGWDPRSADGKGNTVAQRAQKHGASHNTVLRITRHASCKIHDCVLVQRVVKEMSA